MQVGSVVRSTLGLGLVPNGQDGLLHPPRIQCLLRFLPHHDHTCILFAPLRGRAGMLHHCA